jgi:hypothetical protein
METLTPKRTNGSTDEPNIVLTRESIFFRLLVFNATFSNISAISWRPVLMMEEAPERTTDHGQGTGKLYHLRLRVECILFCNLQSRARTHGNRSVHHDTELNMGRH